MNLRNTVCCLLLLVVTVSAFAVEVDETSDRQGDVQIKKVVPDRNKRGLVEFSDEMGTDNEIATDDICSPAEGAAVESGRRPRQKMGEITKIPKCDAGKYAKLFCNRGEFQGIHYECAPCPIGYYKPNRRKLRYKGCARCASFQGTISTGATYCINLCKKGQFLATPGARSNRICHDCPIGEYMPRKNLERSCIECPDGKTTTKIGTTEEGHCSYPTTSVPSPSTTEPRETTTAEPAKLPDINCDGAHNCNHLNAFCDRYRPDGEAQKCRCPWNQPFREDTGTCSTDSHSNFVCHSYTAADRQRPGGEREQCEGSEPWVAGNRVFMAGLPNFGACSDSGCWCCEIP